MAKKIKTDFLTHNRPVIHAPSYERDVDALFGEHEADMQPELAALHYELACATSLETFDAVPGTTSRQASVGAYSIDFAPDPSGALCLVRLRVQGRR